MGAEIRLPYYFALLAETYGRAGLMGEALASISTGLAFAGKNGEDWAVSELHRVQGNLMAGEGKMDAARASYRRGWEAAMRSGSPGFADRLSSLLWEGTPEIAAAERL
jgi:predicted ATPase